MQKVTHWGIHEGSDEATKTVISTYLFHPNSSMCRSIQLFSPFFLSTPSFHWTHGYLEWGLYSPISLAAECHQVWTGKRRAEGHRVWPGERQAEGHQVWTGERQAEAFCSSFWESSLKDSWCRPFTPSSSFLLPATYNVHTHTLAGSPKAVIYYE